MNKTMVIYMMHRAIVYSLSRGMSSGLDFIINIKSYPFEFFRILVSNSRCVFVYEDSWDSSSSTSEETSHMAVRIRILQTDNPRGSYSVDHNCDYSSFESTIEMLEGGDLFKCILMSKPNEPVHYNSRNLNIANVESNSRLLVLDLWNQDPIDCPNDSKYVSVLGSYDVCRSSNIYWGFSEMVVPVDTSSSTTARVCESLGQSLDELTLVCTNALTTYINIYRT